MRQMATAIRNRTGGFGTSHGPSQNDTSVERRRDEESKVHDKEHDRGRRVARAVDVFIYLRVSPLINPWTELILVIIAIITGCRQDIGWTIEQATHAALALPPDT